MNLESLESRFERIGAPEILNALADGAYITDPDRKIVFWNRAAERITGWPAREVVHHWCGDNILVHVDKDGHLLCGQEYCPLHRAIVTGETSEEPLLVFARHKKGYRIPLEVSVAPLRDQEGRTVGGIEVFRDLTSLMEDLRRAKAIQDHALESSVPVDARVRFAVRYVPEELVGGDFYRIEALTADLYAVMLADVMGHGMAAALYTMQLRSLWEECRADLTCPARFAAALNRRLHRLASPDGYFATAFLLLYNAAAGEWRYVRAGHPSPLLCRRQGAIERLDHVSPALGLRTDAVYVETAGQLEPGDTLLLLTDGAIELEDKQGRQLGEDGLKGLIAGDAGTLLDLAQIEEKLLRFCNRIRLPDDLTLLSVHRCEERRATLTTKSAKNTEQP